MFFHGYASDFCFFIPFLAMHKSFLVLNLFFGLKLFSFSL